MWLTPVILDKAKNPAVPSARMSGSPAARFPQEMEWWSALTSMRCLVPAFEKRVEVNASHLA
jgi:hypothetical protein